MASPAWPAPITTTVAARRPQTTSTATAVGFVTMSYTAERFCDWATSASMSSREASASMSYRTTTVEPVAHLGVGAEDPEDVHVPLDRRGHRVELDPAVLGHGGHAGGEAPHEADEHELDGRGAVVLGREALGVVDVEAEGAAVLLLGAEPAEALDGAVAVGAPLPGATRPPLELGGIGRTGQGVAGIEQGLDVHAVVDGAVGHGHGGSPVQGLVW